MRSSNTPPLFKRGQGAQGDPAPAAASPRVGRRRGAALGLVAAVLGALPFAASAIEEPAYALVRSFDGWEVRRYAPAIEAQVTVTAPWGDAVNAGFRVLADYIFGGNQPNTSIAMTAPVAAQRTAEGESIAMTAPVAAQRAPGEGANERYTVAFTMPAQWTLDTLPKPNDPRIELVQRQPRVVAVLSFGLWATTERVTEKIAALRSRMVAEGLTPIGEPIVAQYSPPWSPPPFRNNEIQWLIEPGTDP